MEYRKLTGAARWIAAASIAAAVPAALFVALAGTALHRHDLVLGGVDVPWGAVAALVLAVVAAVGPARAEHAEYAWPPERLPNESPSDGWYAPLPLLTRPSFPCGKSVAPPMVCELTVHAFAVGFVAGGAIL